MKTCLVIFDMDGTVLDTLTDLYIATDYALKKSGFPERSFAEVKSFVGNGIKKLIERALPAKAEESADKVLSDFTDYYARHCYDNTKPYLGVVETIKRIREMGIKTAVVSNKDEYAVKILVDKFFFGLFDDVRGVKEGVNKKPAPDMTQMVLTKLGIDKSNAVYVGDSDVDFLTAQNSALDFIGAEWGFKGRDFLLALGVDEIAKTPTDILKFLES